MGKKKHAYLLSTHSQKPNLSKNLNNLIKWEADRDYQVILTALLDRLQNYHILKHSFVLPVNMSCNNLNYTQHTSSYSNHIPQFDRNIKFPFLIYFLFALAGGHAAVIYSFQCNTIFHSLSQRISLGKRTYTIHSSNTKQFYLIQNDFCEVIVIYYASLHFQDNSKLCPWRILRNVFILQFNTIT